MRADAVLMAGGKGTRLRPFTAVLPKPLVPLGEMPIIEVLLRRLSAFCFERVTVSTGHLAELIRAVCGDGEKFGIAIEYVHEGEPLGTAGALGLLPDKDSLDALVVMNGDLLTTLNFEALMRFHAEQSADVTIATFRREVRIDFGVVESSDANEFVGFKEKPVYEMDVSMGVNVLSGFALRQISSGEYLDMPDLILRVRDAGGKVACYQEDCLWLDIGRPDDYATAQDEFSKNPERYLCR